SSVQDLGVTMESPQACDIPRRLALVRGKESSMATQSLPVRIGIYGPEEVVSRESRGCALWATGYAAALTAAGATPVAVEERTTNQAWKELLGDLDGIVFTGGNRLSAHTLANEAQLCEWCRRHRLPLLGVDHGMQALNATFGGTLYLDVATE